MMIRNLKFLKPFPHQMISIFIKTTKGDLCDVSINQLATISQLKDEIINEAKLELSNQAQIHLIFRGKQLADDRTLKSYGIEEGSNIYMFFKLEKSPEAVQKTKSKTQAPMNGMMAMFQSPIGQSMMKIIEDNPQIYIDMITSNPAYKNLAEQNPQLQHVLNDPELLSEQMKMMTNPENMGQTARTIDRMLDTVESMPGGFQALTKHYNELQDPLMEGLVNQMKIPQANKTNIPETPLLEPSSEPLPMSQSNNSQIPFMPFLGNNPNSLIDGLSGFGDFGLNIPNLPPPTQPLQGKSMINPVIPQQKVSPTEGEKLIMEGIKMCQESGFDILAIPGMDPLFKSYSSVSKSDLKFSQAQLENRFRKDLKELSEMGFHDQEININALLQTDGNLDTAIDWIIGQQQF